MLQWPASLPQRVDQGFTEQPPDVLLRTEMEDGRPKRRPRVTKGVEPVTASISALSSSQVGTLRSFYEDTCVNGSLPFEWVHPRSGNTVQLHWKKPPQIQHEEADLWSAGLELEILP